MSINDQDFSTGVITTDATWSPFDTTQTNITYWPTYPYCTHGGISDYSIEDLAKELSRRILAKDSEGAALEKLLKDIRSKRVTLKT